MTPEGLVGYEVREDVAFLTLNAPPLNVLSAAMMLELADALGRAQADPALKAVALTARGKAFSAGADVGEHRPEQAPAMIAGFSRLFSALGASELPLVMVVDDRLVTMKALEVPAEGATVELPVTADWGPGAYVTAVLYRPMDLAAKRMPGRAVGLAWAAALSTAVALLWSRAARRIVVQGG